MEDSAYTVHGFRQAVSRASNIAHSVSLFVKAKERSIVRIDLSDDVANSIRAYFDLTTGLVGTVSNNGTASGGSANITALANGWYRVEVGGIPASASTGSVRMTVRMETSGSSTGYQGDGTSGMYMWGAQLESWASNATLPMFCSSYIPTTSAQVTRGADLALITGSNFTSIFGAASQGTMFVEGITPATTAGTSYGLFGLSDNTSNNRIQLLRFPDTTVPCALVATGGVFQAFMASFGDMTIWPGTTKGRLAMRFAANDFAFCANGRAALTDTSGSVPTVTQAEIGYGQALGRSQCIVTRVAFWQTLLTNAQLQALAT